MAGVKVVEGATGGCLNVTDQQICVCAAVVTVRSEQCV